MAQLLEGRPGTVERPTGGAYTPTGRPVLAPTAPPRAASAIVAPENTRKKRGLAAGINWVGKEALATLVMSFLVSLLCFYVSAYAQVQAQSFEVKELSLKLARAQAEEQAMRAAISHALAPQTVAQYAKDKQMVAGPPQAMNLLTLPAGKKTSGQNDFPSTPLTEPDTPPDDGVAKQTP